MESNLAKHKSLTMGSSSLEKKKFVSDKTKKKTLVSSLKQNLAISQEVNWELIKHTNQKSYLEHNT